jgi:eukaryotic-like serine/threonine-protein kinase
MADLVGLMAVILSLGTPAYIVKRVMDSKDRRAKLALESGGATGGDHVKRLEEENKRLRERVENLESIVVGVDYELNQKIARLVDGASLAGLPAAPAVARPTAEQRAARLTGEQVAATAPAGVAGGDSPPPGTTKPVSGLERTMTHHPSPGGGGHTSELRPGEILAKRYTIQRLLGKGGMGAVYLASDEVLGEPVALKVISSSSAPWDPTLVERFRREAAAARKISSPNVIRLHDLGEALPGLLYLSMEYFPGRTLSDVIARRGVVPLATCRDYLHQICAGLTAAHDAGVVHRDLKPQNVMVGERDAVKIIDFGLAKARAEDGLTMTGALLGTPLYMAPEQIRGKSVDARADVYALGALAFHLVTGRPPLTGDNAIAIGFAHLSEVPVRAKTLRPDLPDAWDAAIAAALEKAPHDRLASASAFRDQIGTP